VRQFGAPLREQLDLQSEARNLARFNANFHRSKRISFPKPIYPLVATDVLVRLLFSNTVAAYASIVPCQRAYAKPLANVLHIKRLLKPCI
jgi:ABC1 atypical kinase-like domain